MTNTPSTDHETDAAGTDDTDLATHLATLASDASGLSEVLNAHHAEGGDIHPETLDKAARLETSLHKVVQALTHHEHLAMGADDIWRMLNREHRGREIDPK